MTAPTQAEDAIHRLPVNAPSLERDFAARGAHYIAGPDQAPHLVQDRGWITGQNAASSSVVARALVQALS